MCIVVVFSVKIRNDYSIYEYEKVSQYTSMYDNVNFVCEYKFLFLFTILIS